MHQRSTKVLNSETLMSLYISVCNVVQIHRIVSLIYQIEDQWQKNMFMNIFLIAIPHTLHSSRGVIQVHFVFFLKQNNESSYFSDQNCSRFLKKLDPLIRNWRSFSGESWNVFKNLRKVDLTFILEFRKTFTGTDKLFGFLRKWNMKATVSIHMTQWVSQNLRSEMWLHLHVTQGKILYPSWHHLAT